MQTRLFIRQQLSHVVLSQELLLDIRRAESLGDPSAWSTARDVRGSARPDSARSVLSAATAGATVSVLAGHCTLTAAAELDALLASRGRSSTDHSEHHRESIC